MTEAQDRGMKFAVFLIGIALPIIGLAVWAKDERARRTQPEGTSRQSSRCHGGGQLPCERSALCLVSLLRFLFRSVYS